MCLNKKTEDADPMGGKNSSWMLVFKKVLIWYPFFINESVGVHQML
jgi:hypothetical protein